MILLLIPLSVSAGIIEGRHAYRKGDFAAARHEFESDLHAGATGNYFLAMMYLRGEGLARDDVRGLGLLKISADQGYAAARYHLGKLHLYGHGVKKNRSLALSLLHSAATDDDYRAVVLLKIIKNGSRGERKDQEQVVAGVRQKAHAGNPVAQLTLAFMHLVGDGVAKDRNQELRWYKAASLKNARAGFMLALMYYFGDGVSQNPVEAVRIMRLAAERGDYRAQYYLGTFYYHGVVAQMNRQSAAAWFKKSAEAGYAEAQLVYGMVLLSGDGVRQDRGLAIEWLGKAARQDNSRAKEVIGELLTYRGRPHSTTPVDPLAVRQSDATQSDSQLRLEGKGLILDQGEYGLKFSLPNIYDAYAPQSKLQSRTVLEKLQGATFEIIFRTPD